MVTDFGKFCRKLRIDNDEFLKDMAGKIGVTSSYLSAVEQGKRKMPSEWAKKITGAYALTDSQQRELFTLTTLDELTDKEKKALEEAMTVLWLDDRSDYINGLWSVIRAILGDDAVNNEGFNLRAWLDVMKTFE